MAPYVARPGETPREVQIERKRRLFAMQDMETLLKERSVPVSPRLSVNGTSNVLFGCGRNGVLM